MQKYGDDLKPEDMEDIVSMYMPHRKRRKLGAALLRLDKLQLLLLTLMLVVCILFVTAFMQEKMGNFTINLNRLELYRKGVSIADNGDFKGFRMQADGNARVFNQAGNFCFQNRTGKAAFGVIMEKTIWRTPIILEMQERKI